MDTKSQDFWWNAPTGKAHTLIFKSLKHWDNKQSQRTEQNLRNFRLYGNSQVLGLRMGETNTISGLSRLTLNVIQSAVDTATSKIAKSKPKPTFLTEDGMFDMATKARKLEQFIGGAFYGMDIYEKGQSIFRDGAVFGDGLLHFYPDALNENLECERVFPEELIVDEDESIYGEPRQMHRIKYVTRQVLVGKYPAFKKQIMDSGTDDEGSYLYDEHAVDILKVVESWHLPTGMKGDKGRHTIVVQRADLLDEDYDEDYFPFEKWAWNPRLLGYWSQGISEQLTGIQIEINKLLKTIQKIIHIGSVPKLFVRSGEKLVDTHLNNAVGTVIRYSGDLPVEKALLSVPPELFLQLDRLYQKAYEIVGISEMAANQKKPQGLDSGKAIREFNDVQSERFAVVSQRWENFYMRCAKKVIKMSKAMASKNKKLAVKALDKRGMKKIKWSDVDMKEDQYVMKIWPTNLLADTPSGKLADVNDMLLSGFLNKRQAYGLLDYPDIEAVTTLETAITREIEATIEDIVDEGEYSSPEPFMDLEYAMPIMQSAYYKYKRAGLEDEKLELFVRWIDDALTIINPPQPPAPEVEGMETGLEEEEDFETLPDELPPIA